MIPDFNNETVWHWCKSDVQISGMAQRMQDETHTAIASHLIFNNEAKNICWKSIAFPTNYDGKNWIFSCRKMKLDLNLLICIKTNSTWIKGINARRATQNLPRENTQRLKCWGGLSAKDPQQLRE